MLLIRKNYAKQTYGGLIGQVPLPKRIINNSGAHSQIVSLKWRNESIRDIFIFNYESQDERLTD